ncbi:MAG: tetratricopeptide repeat protein, partial [Planctomycetota bacterium]|nr:tetratricopeptide repeat protein [Planctomycetota bacterium]
LIEARQDRPVEAKRLAAEALAFYSRQAVALPILKRPALSSKEVHSVLLEDHGLYFNQPSTAFYFRKAKKLIDQGQESKSAAAFESALKALKVVQWRIPTHGLAMTKAALCQASLGRFSMALDSARIAPFLTPNQADAFELQAQLHSHQFRSATRNDHGIAKNLRKALGALQSMRSCCEGPWVNSRAFTLEAIIHLESKDYGKALKATKNAQLTLPETDSPIACHELAALLKLQAKIYKAKGDAQNTRHAQDLLFKLNIKQAKLRDVHYEAGQKLFSQRKYNAAIKEYKRAVEYNAFRGQIHYDLGRAYMKIGNFIPGVLSVMTAVEHDPRLAHEIAMTLRPGSFVVDPQRIIDELDKLVKSYPKRAHVYVLRAYFYCYFATHYPNEKLAEDSVATGLSDCHQALKNNPRFHFARLIRADLLSFSGRFDKANSDYESALAALPNWDTALSSQAIHYFRIASKASGIDAERYQELAIKNFARCVQLGFTNFQYRRDPIMKIVRENENYKNLIKRLPK